VSLNKFAHLDEVEFAKSYLGTPYTLTTEYQCPTTYNSRTAGSAIGSVSYKNTYATSVKDQGSCGSCWTFGAGMAIEAALCKSGQQNCRNWKGVSTQQILDCASSNSNLNPYNNNGCNGGFQSNAMRWSWYENKGIANWNSYSSYSAKVGTCKSGTDAGKISSCASMSGTDEDGMAALIKNHGPATIAIDASGLGFQLYTGGTYDSSSCSSSRLNHAVGVTGFTSSTWEVKNSWGTGWGAAGYANFKRGKNLCGVASDVAWALV